MAYEIEEHIHRFAAWAAGTAYQRGRKEKGIKGRDVELAQKILSEHPIRHFILSPNDLPQSQGEFDIEHRKWRYEVIQQAEKEFDSGFGHEEITKEDNKNEEKYTKEQIREAIQNSKDQFTHGVVAKLINVYLKSIIICGGFYDHPYTEFIHPPIDRELLGKLKENFGSENNFWQKDWKSGYWTWSNLNSFRYQQIINQIRLILGCSETLQIKPLWKIEEYWQGHQ
ncbi:MAG: hypothetical protein GDA55_03425 [Cellvibrionales bacterium]|nr:hypothetical protein [Cellvibrionales bacterium]